MTSQKVFFRALNKMNNLKACGRGSSSLFFSLSFGFVLLSCSHISSRFDNKSEPTAADSKVDSKSAGQNQSKSETLVLAESTVEGGAQRAPTTAASQEKVVSPKAALAPATTSAGASTSAATTTATAEPEQKVKSVSSGAISNSIPVVPTGSTGPAVSSQTPVAAAGAAPAAGPSEGGAPAGAGPTAVGPAAGSTQPAAVSLVNAPVLQGQSLAPKAQVQVSLPKRTGVDNPAASASEWDTTSMVPRANSSLGSTSSQAGDNSDGNSGPRPPDLPSFRLSDPEAPKVVDQELESIPTEINPKVEKWINYFQGKGHAHMERYLARSTRYEKVMKKVLRDNGLPDDLFYIALIESGFNFTARSRAQAVGCWQFIRGTGRRYGLAINALVDERRDPVLSTYAAAEYFKGLYSAFGSWYLSMAAYNVGENRIKKAVIKHASRDFWEITQKRRALPRETVDYIPKFIAAKLIAQHPEKYGFEEIDYLAPIEFDHFTFDKPINLRVFAEKINVNYEDIKALNPKFKGEIAPLVANKLEIRVPPGMVEIATIAAGESVTEKVEYVSDSDDVKSYKIRSGESLHLIARRFKTTVAYLRDLNDISRGRRLRVGTRIFVPNRTPVADKRVVAKGSSSGSGKIAKLGGVLVAGQGANASSELGILGTGGNINQNQNTNSSTSSGVSKMVGLRPLTEAATIELGKDGSRYYIVQSGDSLYTIAQRYAITVNKLKHINKIRRGRLLKVGLKLKLPTEAQNIDSTKDPKAKPSTQTGSRRKLKKPVRVVRR